MSSFKFPPPPPPPPKAASTENSQHTNRRDGSGRGRGDRSNERGGRGRGSFNNNFGPHSRGGHDQGSTRRDGRGYPNSNSAGHKRGGSQHGLRQQQYGHSATQMDNSLTGSYASPPLVSLPHHGGMAQPQVDPNALAHAMSFMGTPAGVQSMAAFANHMATATASHVPPSSHMHPVQHVQSLQLSSTGQQAGQKRKWEECHHNGQSKPQPPLKSRQQGSKPPRVKAAVPPAVPNFGFSLSKASSTHAPNAKSSSINTKQDERKGKVQLGLTSQLVPESTSEEEEDSDEEAALSAKIKGGGYTFEHDGQYISLQTGADIAAWKKDRRAAFPTQEKIREKAQAAAAKRKHELEFMRKLSGRPPRSESPAKAPPRPKAKDKDRDKRRVKQHDKKQEKLAALRKKLHESMLSKKEAPVAVDLGLGYGSETESGSEESSVLSESSVVSSSEESDEESDAEEDSKGSDSDTAPEEVSSKIESKSINIPPPAVPPQQVNIKLDKDKVCPQYKRYGKCSFGMSCKFHHPTVEPKRQSLFERLVEQELLKTDQLALEAIKYLGQNGYLG